MRVWTPWLMVCLTVAASFAATAERASISGTVTDAAGKPLEHATVMVYFAGVKHGFSAYCPSCYADCGKRTLTDAAGGFTIANLDPDLWFTLLVADDGYTPQFVEKIDPEQGKPPAALLRERKAVEDPSHIVRGLVVDAHGRPVRDAIVEPRGVGMLKDGKPAGTMFGNIRGLDPLAVTNAKGEFELAYNQPTNKMVFAIEARGLAPKAFLNVPTGAERQTFRLSDGATVRGRVLQDGKPVAGAEVGLVSQERPNGAGYQEVRLGTQEDGSFAFTNVPAGEHYFVYPKMESIAKVGAARYKEVSTKDDGQEIDVGTIALQAGHRLRGRLVLSDGRPVPEGTHVILGQGCAVCVVKDGNFGYFQLADAQTTIADADGNFEFAGLPDGPYQVTVSVRGYWLTDAYKVIPPEGIDSSLWKASAEYMQSEWRQIGTVETMVKGDVDNLKIVLEPRPAR